MKLSRFFYALVTAVCCYVILSAQESTAVDWQLVDVDGLFTFRLPQGFAKHDMAQADAPVGEYYKGSTKLVFKWKPAVVRFDQRRDKSMNDYDEMISRIGGKRANIRTYWQNTNGERVYHAELNVGNWERGELELYMGISSRDQSAMSEAKRIFRSITFPLPSPERPINRFLSD